MRRAGPVATLVFASFGMRTTLRPVSVLEDPAAAPETNLRLVRDVLRALLFIMTGWDGGVVSVVVHLSEILK